MNLMAKPENIPFTNTSECRYYNQMDIKAEKPQSKLFLELSLPILSPNFTS